MLILTISKTPAQNIWSDVSLDRNSAYVGQPIEVTISVYTSTWFTQGLDIGNIKVNGAFTVYFRPVTTSYTEDGVTYSGVKQIYHVFPYTEQDITFPELDIVVESPAPGEYKGRKQTVKTQPKPIRVKPRPSKFSESDWLVASGMSVTERWTGIAGNPDGKKVKVGDVLERSISRTVAGTVSELIPPIAWDSVEHVSLYPSRSEVNNNKTKTEISASRTDHISYLFEKEGEVVFPEVVLTWYNPYRNQLYKRTLKEIRVQVEPNPDLGMLASVRDSLAAQQDELAKEDLLEDKPFTILGISPEKFVALSVGVVLVFIFLIRVLRKMITMQKKRRASYLASELYYFHEFKKSLASKDDKSIASKLYRWLDALDLEQPSATYFAKRYGSATLQDQVAEMESKWDNGGQFSALDWKEWESARKNYLKRGVVLKTGWIKPV
ncbi:MAG: BatD family protein [Algoriphagus sp.]|uniref:BatD family protein n=1 Tax=Algoriphagus sp. TaxID=1872435 RepID=UPI003298DA70